VTWAILSHRPGAEDDISCTKEGALGAHAGTGVRPVRAHQGTVGLLDECSRAKGDVLKNSNLRGRQRRPAATAQDPPTRAVVTDTSPKGDMHTVNFHYIV
jgi:hypothetical protein